jgi:hypothetical protein
MWLVVGQNVSVYGGKGKAVLVPRSTEYENAYLSLSWGWTQTMAVNSSTSIFIPTATEKGLSSLALVPTRRMIVVMWNRRTGR